VTHNHVNSMGFQNRTCKDW